MRLYNIFDIVFVQHDGLQATFINAMDSESLRYQYLYLLVYMSNEPDNFKCQENEGTWQNRKFRTQSVFSHGQNFDSHIRHILRYLAGITPKHAANMEHQLQILANG